MLRIGVLAMALLSGFCMIAPAQEGHPLAGSWHGDWGAGSGQRTPIFFYLKWDSKNVVGTINPGPHAIPLKVATLDAEHWTVHFEAETKDAAGKPVSIVIDGKLDNIGSYHRIITGTWSQGSVKGDFKLTRD